MVINISPSIMLRTRIYGFPKEKLDLIIQHDHLAFPDELRRPTVYEWTRWLVERRIKELKG